jgi:carbonic anhydrase/acetyltransferase-like protein (isoleucine patch superfamily)
MHSETDGGIEAEIILREIAVDKCHERRTSWRGWLFPWVCAVYSTLMLGVPSLLTVLVVRSASRFQLMSVVLLPPAWTIAFVVTAGALSVPHQFSIRPGKFRRDMSDAMYFHRRLYGLCWTAVYYNKPVYHLCLSLPFLKWVAFRIFGYRGSMDFTVYPDTWIRDLPLLRFEDGVYISNRATLGTNIVLASGYLLVDGITLRARSLVGHLAMLAPGVELQEGAEVAVGGGIGIRATLGPGSFVGPCCTVEHGVMLGANAVVGAHSYVGSGSVIPDHFRLPAGSLVAPRTRVGRSEGKEGRVPSPQVKE